MSAPSGLRERLREGVALRAVGDDLWSALPAATEGLGSRVESDSGSDSSYDSRVDLYDRVIGNRHYQRLAWGNDPARDAKLAVRAVESAEGWLLDAGCGSLLFTAEVHAGSTRPTVLLDLSLGMLARARERLVERCGAVPAHITLLQADVLALPFAAASFDTVLCLGILHLFPDPGEVAAGLDAVLSEEGALFSSSLVTDRAVGAFLLRRMAAAGEVRSLLDTAALRARLEAGTGRTVRCRTSGNMAHAQTVGRRRAREGSGAGSATEAVGGDARAQREVEHAAGRGGMRGEEGSAGERSEEVTR